MKKQDDDDDNVETPIFIPLEMQHPPILRAGRSDIPVRQFRLKASQDESTSIPTCVTFPQSNVPQEDTTAPGLSSAKRCRRLRDYRLGPILIRNQSRHGSQPCLRIDVGLKRSSA